jgi:hypothetical protein
MSAPKWVRELVEPLGANENLSGTEFLKRRVSLYFINGFNIA